MLFSDWRSKTSARASKARQQRGPRKGFRRAWAEYLENRILMAVRIWDGTPDGGGSSANANWSTPSNWLGDVAPLADDNLVFPAGASLSTNFNDFTSGTRFRSISISGNYNINGQPLVLLEGVTANHTSGIASLLAPITLQANQTFLSANPGAALNLGPIDTATLQLLTVDGSGNVNLTGTVSGSGGITKTGDGTLFISGATDNTYSGITTVSVGVLVVQKDNGLGSIVAGTSVASGAALHMQGNITVPEPIAIVGNGLGTGFDGLGALRGVGGTSTITGDVALQSGNVFIGVDAGARLNLNGAVRGLAATTDGGFSKFGNGTLELSGNRQNQITGPVTVLQGTVLLNKTAAGHAIDGNITIGDNIQGDNRSVLRLAQNDQIAATNMFGTIQNTVTINSSGFLDLNGFNTSIGAVTMVNGPTYSADIRTGTGTLSLTGNVTVTNFQGSSILSPPSFISGNVDLGINLSINQNATITRGFNVGQAAVPGAAPDLLITANISGAPEVAFHKVGAGNLRLAGNNTYHGPTILQTGFISLSTDSPFGDGVLSLAGTSLIALDGPRTISNRVSLDNTVNILGTNPLTFTGPALLTADRTINVYDPLQVVTFAGSIGEGVFGSRSLLKGGKGILELTAANTFSGTTTINQDGGTLRLSGNGTLQNNSLITVGVGTTLAIDNTAINNLDRIHDLAGLTLNGGVFSFTGHAGSAAGERFGILTFNDNLASGIESNVSTTPGSSVHLVTASMPTVGGNRMISFVGNGEGFSATGANRFTIALPAAPALTNGILPLVSMRGPSGYDLTTIQSTAEGIDVVPLPASAYVTDITKAEPTSNVKLTGNQTLDDTRTINALVLGPGVTLQGLGSTLTVSTGGLIADDQSALRVNVVNFPGAATITTPLGGVSIIGSTIVGGAGQNLGIGGGGKVIFAAANQMAAGILVQQGTLNIQNSLALGAVSAGTTVRQGAVLELEQGGFGPVNIPTEGLTVTGTGINNGGVIRNVIGVNSWAGNVSINGDATDQLTLLGLPTLTATAILNVADGTRLTLNGVVSGAAELVKTADGTLELGGVFANTYTSPTRIVDGTLLLNKAPGVAAVTTTIFVGDDLGGAADDVLRLGGPDQIPDTVTVTVNSSGNFDLSGYSEATAGATLFIGPASAASIFIGPGGLWTTSGNINVQTLGGNNPSGALIVGGTLALSILGTNTAFTRSWLVNDGAVGPDLFVNATIVDGSIQANGAITKIGFGTLQYDGSQANTYTGTTTVTDGTLILNKPANTQAFAGNLSIGDGALTSGGVNSDVVKLLQPNQIPDFQTTVTIASTGLLDMTDMDETLGTTQGAAITTRLTINGGNVITGVGVLTVNGNIASGAANAPATISGILNMGSSAMSINVADNGPVVYDLIISADMIGTNSNELYKLGTGTLLLTGTNSYSGRTYHTAGTIALGSDSALGSGAIYLQSASLTSYGAQRFLNNTIMLSPGVTLVGGNALTFTGLVNMTAATTITVANSTFLTFSGGVGELFGSQSLTKAGSGFLRLSSLSSYSGSTTINNTGGAILLSGAGALPNTSAMTIGLGGTLALDNRSFNINNRLRDVSPITLNGMIDFVGHSGGTNEIIGNITTPAGFITSIRSTSTGALAKLTANSLTRGANGMIDFQGFGSDLGSATNQLQFFNFPVLTAGILPFTTLTKPGDLDFVTYGLTGIAAAPFVTDINNATGKDNVKLTSSANITSAKNVNALLVRGSGVVLSGTSTLTVVSGTIFGAGGQNAITVPTIDLGINPAAIEVDYGSQLAVSSSIVGSGGITKFDDGKLIFSGASTYAGLTTVAQGILNIQNSLALGAAGLNLATNGTTVLGGAALEIEATSGPVNVPEELLTINGVGYGMLHLTLNATTSGNKGALRNISGSNTWAGGVVVSTTSTNTTAFGVDSGQLIINGIVSGGTGVNVGKLGPGTLQLGGTASNTWTPGTTTVFEGTLELNKSAGLVAVPTNLVVGDSVDGAAVVRLLNDGQLLTSGTVTVGAEGFLDLNNFSSRVATLNMVNGYSSAAIVASGSGIFTITTAINSNPLAGSLGSTVPATISGNVNLAIAGAASGGRTVTITETLADDDLIITANIADGDDNVANRQGINKAGTGRLVLSGASTYTGPTNVSAGAVSARSNLALGDGGAGAGTVVSSGAALEVQGDINVVNEPISLNQNGIGVTGSLRSISGNNTWTGNVTIATSSVIGVDAGSHLNLSGVLTIAAGNLTMFKLLPGTLELSGPDSNVFNGIISTVAMREGTLLLNKDAGADAIPVNGNLSVGNDYGGQNGDVVRLLQSNQINDSATITVANSGLLDLNNQNESVGLLTLNYGTTYSGNITTGTGTLTLASNVIVQPTGGVVTTIDTPAAKIDGRLDLGNASRTMNVTVNALMPREFEIHATVSNPNGGSINKTNSGALALTGDNTATLTGTTNLAAGNLVVGHNGALGASTLNITGLATNLRALSGGGPITLNNAVTLNGNVSITGDQNLTLNGQVTQVGGARTLSFVMTPTATGDLAGTINLGTAATMVINSSTFNGVASVSGTIVDGTGAGGISKGGTGRLIVSGNNTFTGAATVAGGVLEMRSNNALGSTVAGTTINAGTALELAGNLTIVEPLTINTNAVGYIVPTGALRSTSGTNFINGNLVLGTASGSDAIGVDAGSQLIVTGLISPTAGQTMNLIKVGAGALELRGGVTPNTYTGTTTVREGTLRLNMAPGTAAFGGGLVIGDDFGGQNGDVVELLADEQIPNAQGITIQSTGRLVGTPSFATSATNEAQTVTLSGNVTGGNFQLTFNGNLTQLIPFNATAQDVDNALEALPNIGAGGVTVTRGGAAPGFVYTIIFTGALGGINQPTLVATDLLSPVAATITVAVATEGGITGQETIGALAMVRGLANAASIDTGAGVLAIGGATNTGFALTNFGLTLDSSPAAVIDGRLNIAAINQATIVRLFTVNETVIPGPSPDLVVNAQISDGDGTAVVQSLTKSGAGTMVMTAANTYSGTTTVNAAYNGLNAITGSLILQGNGGIVFDFTNTISVTAGASIVLDNRAQSANRIHDQAGITLAGGMLELYGNDAGTTENFGVMTINPGVGFESVIHSITRGGNLTQLVGSSMLRGNGSVLRLVGERSDGPGGHLGDAENQIRFTAAVPLVNNVVPFATMLGPGTFDLVTDVDPGTDISLGRVLVYDSINTPGGNVKLTSSDTLTADNSINALIIDGNNVSLSGGFNLGIGNGSIYGATIASRGTSNSISVPLIDFGNREVLLSVESGDLNIASSMNSVSTHVRKERPGNLILSGNNNGGSGFQLEGNITVDQGNLTVRHGDALGTNANGTFINSFATLVLDAQNSSMLVNEESLTLNWNFGINNGLTPVVRAINGQSAYGFGSAPITTVGGTIIYDVNLGSELVLNAVIGGGGNGLTKIGDGTLELGGFNPNTFTGTVTVNQGELRLNKSNGNAISGALVIGDRSGNNDRVTYGSSGSLDMLLGNSITINQGATFDNGSTNDTLGNVTMNGGSFISTSTGVINITGTITYNAGGPALIGANLDFGNASRTINIADGGDLNDVRFTGNLQGGTLVKAGAGTILMDGNFSTGNFALNGGIMSLASNNGLGSGTLNFLSNSTLRADLFDVTIVNPIVFSNSILAQATLTLGGRRDTGFTAALKLAGTMTLPTPTAAGTVLNINVDEPLVNAEISGIIGGGNDSLVLGKTGIGRLRLSNDNTFNVRPSLATAPPATGTQAGISITGGILTLAHSHALGVSATNVNVRGDVFATLELDGANGSIHLPSDKTIILFSGNGVPATGYLNNYTGLVRNLAGNNSIDGVVDLRGIATTNNQVVNVYVNVEAGSGLEINNRIVGSNNIGPDGNTENANRGVIKIGAGELTYSGNTSNTITGTTQVWNGTLTLNKTGGVDAVRGTLLVGDNIGNQASDVVRLAQDNQLSRTTTLTVNGSGEYNMNGANDTIGALNLIVGQPGAPTLTMGSRTLEINGNVSVSAYGGIDGPTSSIVMAGNLTLTSTGNATRIFTVANTPTDIDIVVSGRINEAGNFTGGLSKAGPGRMLLSGVSSYTGGVSVTGGCLTVGNSASLGSANLGNVSVSAGAVLELLPNVNIGTKTLTLNGNGFIDSGTTANIVSAVGSGALVSLGGNTSWAGDVILSTTATQVGINVASGRLRIDGAVSAVGGQTVGLVKLGSGDLEFNGNTSNTYNGPTLVNGGSLLLNKSGNATAIAAGTLIIGDNFGGDNADQVNYLGNSTNMIGGASVVILPTGQFNMNDASDTIGALTASFGPTTGDVNVGLGNLSLGGNLVAIVAAGVLASAPGLTLTGTLDLDGAARTIIIYDSPVSNELNISASMTGASAATLTITAVGTSVVEMSGNGPNVYLGATVFNEGTLILNKSVGPAIPGNVTIGDGLGGAVDLVRYGSAADNDQIGNASVVTVATSGILDLATNNKSDALAGGGLTLAIGNVFSSRIQTGTGVLTLLGNVNVTAPAASTVDSPAVVISGNLDLQLLGGGSATRTVTVADSLAPVDMIISAVIGDGDLTPQSFTKAGAGTLLLSGNNTFTGSVTSSLGNLILEGSNAAAGFTTVTTGDLILRNFGSINASPGYSLGAGARVFIDNSLVNVANRINDIAPITLSGNNTLTFIGRPGAVSTESVGSIIVASNTTSTIESDVSTVAGSQSVLTGVNLVRLPGAKVTFVGGGNSLGSATNQIKFVSPPALTPATTGILPYATLLNPSGPDLVTYGVNGITAPTYATSLATAGPNDTVKLTASEIFNGVQTIGALILVGDGIDLTGVGQLRIASGSITVVGAHSLGNSISIAEVALGAVTESLINIDTSSTLTISGAISADASNTIRKQGTGTLVLAGDNTVTGGGLNGNVSIEQGALKITHGKALGNTFPQTSTSVAGTAALQIEGSIAVGNETLTLAGTGVGNDGGGSLQLLSGNATWGTGNTPINLSATNVGVAAGSRLTLNSTLNGAVVMTKVGQGTLTLTGNSANAQSTTVNEGTVELAKIAAVAATSTMVIGDNLGGDNADRVVIVTPFANQMVTNAGVTINSTGLLDMNGANLTINGLTLLIGDDSAGDVTTGAGTITMVGNITVNTVAAPLMTSNASVPATIAGNMLTPATRNIALTDSPANYDLIITANLSGNSGFTTSGAGRMVFDPTVANTFTGGINLGNGTILTLRNSAGNNSALGADTAGVTVNSSAALELENFVMTGAENVNLLGPGFGGRGGLRSVVGANGWGNGTITLSAPGAIGVDTGSSLAILGQINNAGNASNSITKVGGGLLDITTTNASITSPTIVSEGTLRFSGAGGTSTSQAYTVNSGATLELNNAAANNFDRLVGNPTINLAGGTLSFVGNALTSSIESVGAITLSSGASTIRSTAGVAGQRLVSDSLTRNAGATVQFEGIGSDIGTGTHTVEFVATPAHANGIIPYATIIGPAGYDFARQTGLSIERLPAANYHTDLATATPTDNVKITASEVGFGNITVNSLLILGNGISIGQTGDSLTVGNGTIGAIAVAGGNNTLAANMPLHFGAAEGVIRTATGGTAIIASPIDGLNAATGLTISGQGVVQLQGNNTYTGVTNILAGGVLLQNANGLGATGTGNGTVVANQASLAIDNVNVGDEALAINGTGFGGFGALINVGGNNTWGTGATAINMPTNSTVNVFGGTLTLNSTVGGAGALTKQGLGTLVLAGTVSNTFTGGVNVNEGLLQLRKSGGNTAITSGVATIGDGIGIDVLQLTGTDNQIAAAVNVVVNSSGIFDLNNRSTTVNNLTLTGSTVNTGTGVLTIGAAVITQPSPNTAVINGFLGLGAVRNFAVYDNPQADDLIVNASISGVGAPTKIGRGSMVLTNVNTYTGTTTAQLGVLEVRNASGLGAATGVAASGTVINNGATLRLTAAPGDTFNIGNETISFPGTGLDGVGVLEVSGNVNWAGAVTLATNPTINVAGNSSLILQDVTGLTFGINKRGAGTLGLAGVSSNTGNTNVLGGTLLVNGATNALNTITIRNGGTLAGNGIVSGTVLVSGGGTVSPGDNGIGTLTTGTLRFTSSSTLFVDIAGMTPGITHDVLKVVGGVFLNGALLAGHVPIIPTIGDQFRMIDNDFVDAVVGNFAAVNVATIDFRNFSINTAGGDGNDVVFTSVFTPSNQAPVINAPPSLIVVLDNGVVIAPFSITDSDAGNATNMKLTLTVSHGTLTLSTSVVGGLTVSDITGNGTNTVTIISSLAKMNATFATGNGLVFRRTAGFLGSDTIVVVADDQGNSGIGGPRQSTRNILLSIVGISAWQNNNPGRSPLDVTNDGNVNSFDVITMVSELNARGAVPLPGIATPPPYMDVNGDGNLSAIDLLLVVAFINDPQNFAPLSTVVVSPDAIAADAETVAVLAASLDAETPTLQYFAFDDEATSAPDHSEDDHVAFALASASSSQQPSAPSAVASPAAAVRTSAPASVIAPADAWDYSDALASDIVDRLFAIDDDVEPAALLTELE